MTTLHTFGCSITQGFALPDLIEPLRDSDGRILTEEECLALSDRVSWESIHVYAPSKYAWPQVLGDQLGIPVINNARRGACFQQIARQCAVAVKDIKPGDVVIVMWTYLSRISLQWPARTSVPLCNLVDPGWGWRTRILPGFNKFFGLSNSTASTEDADGLIHDYIHGATQSYLNPLGVYNQYYNSLVLQSMTDGYLRATGARVIHLSVEPESSLEQLELARLALDPALGNYDRIPDPESWYTVPVDHALCRVIHDPRIPPAENDMHPSITHHKNFARSVHQQYFQNSPLIS